MEWQCTREYWKKNIAIIIETVKYILPKGSTESHWNRRPSQRASVAVNYWATTCSTVHFKSLSFPSFVLGFLLARGAFLLCLPSCFLVKILPNILYFSSLCLCVRRRQFKSISHIRPFSRDSYIFLILLFVKHMHKEFSIIKFLSFLKEFI